MEEKSAHEIAAETQQHDSSGRFVSKPHPDTPHSGNPVSNFLHEEMSVQSTNKDDTIVDVHVNNPLKKITHLLEEIKSQKAFSFNIRGSLGMAGVVLALTAFGIFGGTKAFCSKGEQSHIGTIVSLQLKEEADNPWIDRARMVWDGITGRPHVVAPILPRIVLIEQNQVIYQILGLAKEQRSIKKGQTYIVTGDVDSCSQTITVTSPSAIQQQ